MLKTTVLIEKHRLLGARFVPFYGWKLPIDFGVSAKEEHLNVRNFVGLFDVSHMGEIRIKGNQALSLLEKLLTSHVSLLKKNESQYSLLCSEKGGIIDDLIVYCLEHGEDYLLCVNASRIETDLGWIARHADQRGVEIRNESSQWSQLALQGPKAEQLLAQVFKNQSLRQLKKFAFQHLTFQDKNVLVSATGYTGERGFEILIPSGGEVLNLWEKIMSKGKDFSCRATGLAARDTLRIEMKYPLYGHDLNEQIDPHSAGLSWLVKNPHSFIGSEALREKKQSITKKWVGFQLSSSSGVPRQSSPILVDGQSVGEVTSGCQSPCLNKMIGLGYVSSQYAKVAQVVQIKIHQDLIPAEIVATPFINK